MEKGRIWTSEEKAKIVVQGLKGHTIAEICSEYQIHQTQYYKWREQFLENIPKVFETKAQSKKEEQLKRENQKLKTMVGELTMKLKKTIGKASSAAKRSNQRIRPDSFADYSATQSRASVLGLSPWAYLSFVERIAINKKRVYRLLRENELLVKGNEKLKARRLSGRSKPRPIEPNSWWGVDMTKVLTAEGWAYLVGSLMIEFTKKVLGTFVASRSRALDWLEAARQAVNRQFPRGILEAKNLELNLMSDNGSQATSLTFMRTCRTLGIKQAFTAYANRKGSADTGRLIDNIQEELCWLREWSSVEELAVEMKKFVEYFNDNYLHSTLGYKTPNAFEAEWLKNNQNTRSATA